MIPTMKFTWTGTEFVPIHPKLADEHFVVDQVYTLSETQDRSDVSHSHYFACLQYAWVNLPEDQVDKFPTVEHLRARALIACGYHSTRQVVLHDPRDALKMAVELTDAEGYDVISVVDNVVTIVKPTSQNYKKMDRKTFQASKEAVVDYCAAMIGMTSVDLARAGSESSKRREK